MIRRFLRETAGNFAVAFTVGLVPIMGGVALAVDYSELSRQKQATLHALDAAGIATAREIVSGSNDASVIAYARDFFDANLGPVSPADATLFVTLPTNAAGGGTLKLAAELIYQPYFLPVFKELIGQPGEDGTHTIKFRASTEIRLKNTLEVALVLDNSGSMDYLGSGSGQKRLALLKDAAKQLVETIALQAQQMKQIDKPVQFSLVPFAASVNVGPHNDGAAWMDTLGRSPAHHENFNWATLPASKGAQRVDGIWVKSGSGWGTEEGEALTRFSLFRDIRKVDSREWVVTGTEWVCTKYKKNGQCDTLVEQETGYYENVEGPFASWQGCVEARPYPHNVANTPPSHMQPETLFVPMFAPDEPGDRWLDERNASLNNYTAANNWWNDDTESSNGQTRLRNMAKYFHVRPFGASSPQGQGPNYSCTSRPITPLTDVSTAEGVTAVKGAIDGMQASGATNVPEGLAWGWRTVASGEPFAGARPETERGNDKVVIVLTDGENTYYTPSSLGFQDPANARSTYSAHGYLQPGYNGTGIGRLYMGTAMGGVYSNANYTSAMNQHMAVLCDNAKAAGVMIMTVALDLNAGNAAQAAAIDSMRACASDSRFRKGADGKAAKLFWNATGATLSDNFKEIADELSNLRIVG